MSCCHGWWSEQLELSLHPHNILICIEVFKLARSAEVHVPINLITTEDEHNEHEERITCQQILHQH